MAVTAIWDRWWCRAFLALILFFGCQMFLILTRVQSLDEEKMTLTAEVESLARKRDELHLKIAEKEREVFRLEKKERAIETLVRDRVSLLVKGQKEDPMIYFITPTYFRPAQLADITRLSYTLAHVPNLHWIVVEDAEATNPAIEDVIRRSRLPYTYISVKTEANRKMQYTDPNWLLPRGVQQRNAALEWLRRQLSNAGNGAVYFGDDDNTYDLRLFGEIRRVKKLGVWPVGIVGGLLVETPFLNSDGTISGFNANWKTERPFPIDMAAFAVNLTLVLQHPNASFSFKVERGYQESNLLTGLGLTRNDIEPLGDNFTKVYVWHTRTEKVKLSKADLARIVKPSEAKFTSLERTALGLEV